VRRPQLNFLGLSPCSTVSYGALLWRVPPLSEVIGVQGSEQSSVILGLLALGRSVRRPGEA